MLVVVVSDIMSKMLAPVIVTGIAGNCNDNNKVLGDGLTNSKVSELGSEVELWDGSKSSKLDIDGELKGLFSTVGVLLLGKDENAEVAGLSAESSISALINCSCEFLHCMPLPLCLVVLTVHWPEPLVCAGDAWFSCSIGSEGAESEYSGDSRLKINRLGH